MTDTNECHWYWSATSGLVNKLIDVDHEWLLAYICKTVAENGHLHPHERLRWTVDRASRTKIEVAAFGGNALLHHGYVAATSEPDWSGEIVQCVERGAGPGGTAARVLMLPEDE